MCYFICNTLGIISSKDMPKQHIESLEIVNGNKRSYLVLNQMSRVEVDQLAVPSIPAFVNNPDDSRFRATSVMVSPTMTRALREAVLPS